MRSAGSFLRWECESRKSGDHRRRISEFVLAIYAVRSDLDKL